MSDDSSITLWSGEGPGGDRDRTPSAGPPAPEMLGRYSIVRELGRGGMGVVYLARDPVLGREVALKVLSSDAPAHDRETLARFREEARALGRVRHPNLVSIHEVGEFDGRPYFTMEYVPGRSLAARLAAGPTPMPVREAAGIVRRTALGLGAVHAAGMVNRDVKPGNVLLDEQGTPRVSDLGIARHLGERAPELRTRTGVIVGTPAYMSPEQIEARRDIGPAADVWAAGAVLYECLAGRPPFGRGDDLLALTNAICYGRPARPSRSNPLIHPDLETILFKCLRKEPRGRYSDGEALAGDLGRFLDGRPILARPPSSGYRLARWFGRHRLAAALFFAAVLAVAALLALRIREGIAEERRTRERTLRGEAALAAGDLDGAGEEFRAASESAPGDPDALRGLYETAKRRNEENRARAEEKIAREVLRAEAERARGEREAVLARSAASLLPLVVHRWRFPRPVLARGARATLEPLAGVAGTGDPRGDALHGLALWFEGRTDEALAALDIAVERDPGDPTSRLAGIEIRLERYRSMLYRRHVRLIDAREWFRFPERPTACGEHDDERELLSRLLADLAAFVVLAPERLAAGDRAYGEALLAHLQGKGPGAVKERLGALRSSPPVLSLDSAVFLECEAALLGGGAAEVREISERMGDLVRAGYRNVWILDLRALLLLELGLPDAALVEWETLSRSRPEDAARWYSRGTSVIAVRGRGREAVRLLLGSLAKLGVPAETRAIWSRAQGGDVRGAAEDAEAAIDRCPAGVLSADDLDWLRVAAQDIGRF